jgi:protease-4
MKQFFKFIFASCLGTLLFLIFLVLIFAVVVQFSKPDHSIPKSSVLKIELSDPIPELTDNVQESAFNLQSSKLLGLREITQLLEKAKTDDKIKAIFINTQFPQIGPATAESIFEALENFKDSGKPILSYGDYYSQGGYYLASLADSVFLNPNGFIELRGYAAVVPFYKKLMDKLGVKMNIYYAGKYKSATEPYREEEMSFESKLQTREYLSDISNHLFSAIAKNRNIEETALNKIISNFSSHNADAAINHKLADQLVYWNDFEKILNEKIGNEEDDKVEYVDLVEYSNYVQAKKEFKSQKNKIAIVHAEGDILYQSKNNGTVGYDKYAKILRKLKKKKDIKSVVLRINSPGGSALASDLLWKEVEDLKASGKHVVSSFGNYAASGGYYIAAPSDYILAESNTLTGSIGAYLMIPQTTELFEEKIGIHFDTIKTHPHAVIWNPIFNVQEKETEVTEQMTEDLYQKFLSRVADGRNMEIDEVHEKAQGRIWSGEDAVQIGLVDALGNLEEAVIKAAELADITEYKVVEYPQIEKNIYLEMISSMMEETKVKTNIFPEAVGKQYKPLLDYFTSLSEQSGLQMRLPFYLDLK